MPIRKHAIRAGCLVFIATSACGFDWFSSKKQDGSERDNESVPASTDSTTTEPPCCSECCDVKPPPIELPTPMAVRYVVKADDEVIGYLASINGSFVTVISTDGNYTATFNSATGYLTGPKYWHYGIPEDGSDGFGNRHYPVSDGPCGEFEGMEPALTPVYAWHADPAGTYEASRTSAPVRVIGGLTTYRFKCRVSTVIQGRGIGYCPTDEDLVDVPADERPEKCGYVVDYSEDLSDVRFNRRKPLTVSAVAVPIDDI